MLAPRVSVRQAPSPSPSTTQCTDKSCSRATDWGYVEGSKVRQVID